MSFRADRFSLWSKGIFLLCFMTSGISLFFFDQPVSQFFSAGHREHIWVFAREITNAGLSSHYFIFSSLLFVFLFLWGRVATDHPEWRRPLLHWSAQFFFSLITSGIVVLLAKFLAGRERPHITSPDFYPWNFAPLNLDWNYQSFPSGHSQVVFCVATMLAIYFPRGRWIFFLLAFGLAFTRVITHSHFISDCIWGGFIGWYVTKLTSIKYAAILKNRTGFQITS